MSVPIPDPAPRVRGHALERYLLRRGAPDPVEFRAYRCSCGNADYGAIKIAAARVLHRAHVSVIRAAMPARGGAPSYPTMSNREQPGVSLLDAKRWLMPLIKDGAHCPCCGQLAKVYRRRISAYMCRVLLAMYRKGGITEWVYLPDIARSIKGGRDESFLGFWRLMEENQDKRADGGRVGWWRVTRKGEQFIRGEIGVIQYVHVYDNRAVHGFGTPGSAGWWPTFTGPEVTLIDALRVRFNYADLMGIPF